MRDGREIHFGRSSLFAPLDHERHHLETDLDRHGTYNMSICEWILYSRAPFAQPVGGEGKQFHNLCLEREAVTWANSKKNNFLATLFEHMAVTSWDTVPAFLCDICWSLLGLRTS